MQIGGQPIERPGGKRQPEGLWLRERRGDHGSGLLRRIGRPAARAVAVLEGFQSFRIEAADALAHGLAIKADPGGNRQALSPDWRAR